MISSTIKTVLIDDNKEYLFMLRENLSIFPEIEIVGEATQYHRAKNLLLNLHPDLVFLDIEMPFKNGFELLEEIRKESHTPFKVIFYTAYNQYLIEALRHSAFDYIVKPAQPEEIKKAIERYKIEAKEQPALPLNAFSPFNDIISLPVSTGLKFADRNRIVYAQTIKEKVIEKACWEINLNNFEKIRLRKGVTASYIQNILGAQIFVCTSQSTFVNKNYISMIEYKTRKCILIPPFDTIEIPVSRLQINDLRGRFDLI
jgi:two-component system, LytTR family, response regulator